MPDAAATYDLLPDFRLCCSPNASDRPRWTGVALRTAATLEAADALGMRREFVRALSDYVLSAAVGPVTAGPLREAGIDPVVPDRHRLGARNLAGQPETC